MEVESLKGYLVTNKDMLIKSIQMGKYRPNPVRRVCIPKENGKQRQLGIPTVVDRVIQQSIAQKLTSIYEPQFSAHSYGFRPKHSAHQALRKCQDYITQGYIYAVDIDLERFFDTVNHNMLIEVLSRTIKDGRVVSLIHKYLNAGVMQEDHYEETYEGVPQGRPISPLLGNILLNELDWWGEKIVSGGTLTYTSTATTITIPLQKYCKTTYGGAPQPEYSIQGTGTINNTGAYPIYTIRYDFIQGGLSIAEISMDFGWPTPYFEAVITTNPAGKKGLDLTHLPIPKPRR